MLGRRLECPPVSGVLGRASGQRLDRHHVAVLQGGDDGTAKRLLREGQQRAQRPAAWLGLAAAGRQQRAQDQAEWGPGLPERVAAGGQLSAEEAVEDVAPAPDFTFLLGPFSK